MDINDKFPLKYGVLYVLCKANKELSIDDIMEQLKPVFGSEKQFTKAVIRFHLDSMVCVDMAKSLNERFDDGVVTADYKVTPFGKKRSVFLPSDWQVDLAL